MNLKLLGHLEKYIIFNPVVQHINLMNNIHLVRHNLVVTRYIDNINYLPGFILTLTINKLNIMSSPILEIKGGTSFLEILL